MAKKSAKERNANIFDQMERYHSGDPKIRNKAVEEILEENENLINDIIHDKYKTYFKFFEDLQQQGRIGIMEALETYDPSKTKPSTYFSFYIKHQISEFTSSFVQGASQHYTKKIRKINEARNELTSMGLDPSPINISVITGYKLDIVKKCIQIELHTQLKNISDEDFMDACVYGSYVPGPDVDYEENEKIEILYKSINDLPEIERICLTAKFGLFDTEPKKNADIAILANIPVANVRKYIQSGLHHLRENEELADVFPDYVKSLSLLNNEISINPVSSADLTMQLLEG